MKFELILMKSESQTNEMWLMIFAVTQNFPIFAFILK
jgi:hypothetical protein